ncbi:MAG: M14 family metallopeptidase [bacterium]
MTNLRRNHYHSYDEMTSWLQEVTERYPNRARLQSIGKTPEGRDIWVVSITRFERGEASDKPAYWIDGNTHASEVLGCEACLRTIDLLMERWDDEDVVRLMTNRAMYVCPRISADGAEYVLKNEHYVRSARRKWPEPHPLPGLNEQDINGDGLILQMRVEAPDGAWRVSKKDNRLLVARMPWDTEGPFYHLWAEGVFDDDAWGNPQKPVRPRDAHGLDFNRNYPSKWQHEPEQPGAGPYPLSEPETKAVVDFLLANRNIGGILTYHTYTGVLLRPYSDRADTEMPPFDLAVYKALGKRFEQHSGFKCVSTFHDFAYDPKKAITGVFDDWAYEQYGVHCFTMELWSPSKHAGLDYSKDLLGFWRDRSEDDEIALLKWNDGELNGEAFVDWQPATHPQLGDVEVGGWRWLYSFRNCPARMIEDEVLPTIEFTLDHLAALPMPKLTLRTERVGDLTKLIARTQNDGYLPTHITSVAAQRDLVNKLHLELELDGSQLVEGSTHLRIDHLAGMAQTSTVGFSSSHFGGRTQSHVDEHAWWLNGPGTARVTWWGDRIGKVSAEITWD